MDSGLAAKRRPGMTASSFALCPKVRAALLGELFGLGAAPGRDFGVVARHQHLGDGAALPKLRPRVMWVFEQAFGEALLGSRRLLAHHARQKPHAGIEQREARDLAAREDEIAERDFLEIAALDDAFVDTLEAAAEDDRARTGSKLGDAPLRQRCTTRRH